MSGLQRTQNLTFGLGRARRGAVAARNILKGLRWIAVTMDTMVTRHRSRLHLESLDDRMLKDIGVSRADVSRESSKPFWRG